jgi:trigger factor
MADYSRVLKHEAENLTLLCPTHHGEKTNKLLGKEVLFEANSSPHNIKSGITTPHKFRFGFNNPTVVLGSVGFTMENQDFAAIVIDGNPMVGFRFEDGHALLQLRIYDETNRQVLKIVDSELVHIVDFGDFEFKGAALTVRSKHRQILLRIRFVPDENLVEINRGTLQYNKVEVEIWPDCFAILNTCSTIAHLTISAPVGFVIGRNPGNLPTLFSLTNIPREFYRDAATRWLADHRPVMPASLNSPEVI